MNNTSGVIQFGGYRILRIEYECPASFAPTTIENASYHFSIANGSMVFPDKTVQVNLFVRAFFNNTEDYDSAPLKTAVEIAGKFAMSDGSEWDEKWMPNAVAILYPYARSIIGSITSQSGRDSIILPTINTQSLIK